MTDQEYEQHLSEIPHLNLTNYLPKVPVDNFLNELLDNLHNIRQFEYSIQGNEQAKQYLRETWQGFSLIDITRVGAHMIDYYTTDFTHERMKELGIEFDEEGWAKFKVTDVGDRMPGIVNYVQNMFEQPGRSRISKLTAGRTIYYHSHAVKAKVNKKKLARSTSNRATIHIPLITNPKCSFAVTKDPGNSVRPDKFEPIDTEHFQYYGIGEVWMFNSIQYHKAQNLGEDDRVHVLLYFDYMDPKIRPIIEQAILDYQGPRIK